MPSSAEYWSIGETTTRFASVMPRSRNGWNIGTVGLCDVDVEALPAHVARHHRVDLGDELRRAQREIVVGDRLGARHQAEREARRVHVPEAPHVLEPDQRHVGRMLRLLDLEPALGLEMRQRRASRPARRRAGTPRSSAIASSIASLVPEPIEKCAVALASPISTMLSWAQRSQWMVGKLRQSERLMISLWPGKLLGEHAFEEARRLPPRRAGRARRARRSRDRSPAPRSSGPARTGSNAR